jgi:ribosome-associated protein
MKISKIKDQIEIILDNNKAKNIVTIDLKKKSYIADYMIIASGTSSRHLQSLSVNLVSELKKIGIYNCRIEGKESNDWKLVDTIDIIIHIFHPEKRKFYDLEKMWSESIPREKVSI